MTRVAVVGAGVMGSAAAWALTERGAEVTIFEQLEPGNTRGSSHGRTRIFRLAYPEAHWVRLAQESLEGWRVLEREWGRGVLDLYGLVELCPSVEITSHDVLDQCGVEHRLLSDDEVADLRLTLAPGWAALWQPQAGVVRSDLALEAFLAVARSRGATLVTNHRVESLDDVDSDVVVVTAGAWVPALLPEVPVRVTRETVAYFRAPGPPFPSVVQLNEMTRGHALYALHDPVYGLKAGVHNGGSPADPDVNGAPDTALVERAADWVREHFSDADPEPVATQTCLYTLTDDESFVLERDGRIVVGSACSGHGFKFAPAVGRRLADLALG